MSIYLDGDLAVFSIYTNTPSSTRIWVIMSMYIARTEMFADNQNILYGGNTHILHLKSTPFLVTNVVFAKEIGSTKYFISISLKPFTAYLRPGSIHIWRYQWKNASTWMQLEEPFPSSLNVSDMTGEKIVNERPHWSSIRRRMIPGLEIYCQTLSLILRASRCPLSPILNHQIAPLNTILDLFLITHMAVLSSPRINGIRSGWFATGKIWTIPSQTSRGWPRTLSKSLRWFSVLTFQGVLFAVVPLCNGEAWNIFDIALPWEISNTHARISGKGGNTVVNLKIRLTRI